MNRIEKSDESVLDQPNQGLCPEIWTVEEGDKPNMTEQARKKIQEIVSWVVERFDIVNQSVNITGSIASNSYSEDSDIDVHISSPVINEDNADEYNKRLRKEYEEQFKGSFQGRDKIGTHPIEVYFQHNPIQDMMSVGCYDFINDKWIVGPELKPTDYDPYTEYYEEDMIYVDSMVQQMREIIFEIYELCFVINDSKDHKFRNERMQEVSAKMQKASSLFDEMREMRTSYSSPKTREDALKLRESPKWKIADSAFKLMAKFGYIPIMKLYKTSYEKIKENPQSIYQVIQEILERFNLSGSEIVDWMKPSTSQIPSQEPTQVGKTELVEGGHMFKDETGAYSCSRINQENVKATMEDIYTRLLPLLKLDKSDTEVLGSTGKKLPGGSSGDVDLAIDYKKIMKAGIKNIHEFVEHVTDICEKEFGYQVAAAESLNLCSVRWPIMNEDGKQSDQFVQLDLMPVVNLNMCSWGMYSPSEHDSTYKGAVRNALLAAIAAATIKTVVKPLPVDGKDVPAEVIRYSFDRQTGLYEVTKNYESKKITKRNPYGIKKTGTTVEGSKHLVSDDPQEIIRILFHKSVPIDKTRTVDDIYNLFKTTDLYKNPETRNNILTSCIRVCDQNEFSYPEYFKTDIVNI